MKKKVKTGIDITLIILVVIIFVLGAMILALYVTRQKTGVPSLFGATFLDIESGSMEPTIKEGDIAVIKKTAQSELKTGDIITFWDTEYAADGSTRTTFLNTHRIIGIYTGGTVYTQEQYAQDEANQSRFATLFPQQIVTTQLDYSTVANLSTVIYITRGDNTSGADNSNRVYSAIVGEYSFRMAGMGYFIRFLQSWYGFMIVVIIPLTAFLVYRVVLLIKAVREYNAEKREIIKEEAVASTAEELRAEIDRLRAMVGQLPQDDSATASPQVETATPATQDDLVKDETADSASETATPATQDDLVKDETADSTSETAAPATQDDLVKDDTADSASETAAPATQDDLVKDDTADSASETVKHVKEPVKKAAAKTTAAKPAAAKTTAAKSTAAKSTAAKSATTKATATKTTAAKTTAAKSATTKTTAAKSATTKATATKSTAAKTTAAKSAEAKTAAKPSEPQPDTAQDKAEE